MAKLYGGTIEYRGKDKDGKGKYWLDMPCGKDPMTGKYRRKREMFHGTKKQAEHRLGELRVELESGKAPDADKIAFADWCEQYLDMREGKGGKRPATFKNDRKCAKHLVARLGDVKLVDMTPAMVDALYTSMRNDGVGDTTVLQCHKLLKRVMKYALVNNIVFRNPCDVVDPPKKPTPKRNALSAGDARRLGSVASSGTPSARKVAVYIGLATGCRMGECLGLVWGNVELDGERPYIYFIQQYTQQGEIAPLKTDDDDNPMGRVYPLDGATVAVLRSWRATQCGELNALGIEQGSKTPVVTNAAGGFQDPARFGEWFRSFCVENGFGRWVDDEGREIVELVVGEGAELYPGCVVEWRDAEGWPCDENGKRFSRSYKRQKTKRHYSGLRYHELRHTHYTLRLADGMDIPTAQALGGWSDPRVLLKTYAHPVPENIWASVGFMDSMAV